MKFCFIIDEAMESFFELFSYVVLLLLFLMLRYDFSLYCDTRDSLERLSCQTVLYFILNTLVQAIGPICPHLGEEILMHYPRLENGKELFLFMYLCNTL